MVVICPLALLLVTAPGLFIQAEPPGTQCPLQDDLSRAVDARLGATVAPARPGQGWVVRYRVDSQTDPEVLNRVTLEIRGQDGQVRLRRQLALGDGSCAGAAEAMALIVERFFRGVQWTAAVPLPEIERAAVPPVVEPIRALALRAGPVVRRSLRFADPGVALDLNWRFARRLAAGAGVILLPVTYKDPTDSSLEVWSVPVRSSVRAAWTVDPFDLQLGPELVLAIEGARRALNPPRQRVYLAAGVAASVLVSVAGRWGVALEASAGWNLPRAPFETYDPGADRFIEVLAPPRVHGMATLQLAYVLSP